MPSITLREKEESFGEANSLWGEASVAGGRQKPCRRKHLAGAGLRPRRPARKSAGQVQRSRRGLRQSLVYPSLVGYQSGDRSILDRGAARTRGGIVLQGFLGMSLCGTGKKSFSRVKAFPVSHLLTFLPKFGHR